MKFDRNKMGVGSDNASFDVPVRTDTFREGAALRLVAGDALRLFTTGSDFYGLYMGAELSAPAAATFANIHAHRPGDIYRVDYATTLVSFASATISSLTFAALSAGMARGWLYICNSTGIGQLRFVSSVAANKATLRHAWTTTPVSGSSKVWLIWPPLKTPALDATCRTLTQAVAQTANPTIDPAILANYLQLTGEAPELMTPANSYTRDGLNAPGVKFIADLMIQSPTFA